MIALACAAGVGLGVAQAQPRSMAGGSCVRPEGLLTPEDRQLVGDRIVQRMRDRLGLTQEQADGIRGVFQAERDRMREDGRKLCEARQELRQLLDRQDADSAKLQEAAAQVKALQGAMLDRHIEMRLALRSKLTPEQWQKWQEIRQGMAARHHGRRPTL